MERMKQQHRAMGAKNVDLWVEGSLYPADPLTHHPPMFSGLTSFVKWVCAGQQGLWGYTSRLSCQVHNVWTSMQSRLAMQQAKEAQLTTALQVKDAECMQLQNVIDNINVEYVELQSQIDTLSVQNRRMQTKLDKVTAMGPRERLRTLKPLEKLAIGGGQWKRRIRACKGFSKALGSENTVDPCIAQVLSKEQVKVALHSKKFKSICDDMQTENMEKVCESFTATDTQGLCDQIGLSGKSYSEIWRQLDNGFKNVYRRKRVLPLPRPVFVRRARKELNVQLMDHIGQPRHLVHTHVYRVQSKKKNDTSSNTQTCAPASRGGKATRGSKRGHASARGNAIDNASARGNAVDSGSVVENAMDSVVFILHERNNFVLDVIKIQQSMVVFYDMTVAECNGLLKFVIKLDESEIVKGQKLERVSITLMNRALNTRIAEDDQKYFSVQSENEIWWLAAFAVPKEDHEVLKVFFGLTGYPDVIKRQSDGEPLHVEGYGDYNVEWHLAGDLKTLKCMYGCSNAANAKMPCLFCMRERITDANGKKCWANEARVGGAPTRDAMVLGANGDMVYKDEKWDPVLPIPLTRVHFCTLHAFVRIIEKLLHLYICFAYNLKPQDASYKACRELEKVLSEIGLHGGDVVIKKDEKKSGKSGDVPCKPCIGGAKARKFLAPPIDDNGRISVRFPERYDGWKKLHNAVPDLTNGGTTRIAKVNIWLQFNKLAPLLQKLKFDDEDASDFGRHIKGFHDAVVAGWGAQSITPYMHILLVHGPYYATQGSLAIWSTQGMERSHWQARCAYQRSTDHGGGHGHKDITTNERVVSNPMLQLLQWWYRRIEIRFAKKLVQCSPPEPPNAESIARALERRRSGYNNSEARERHAIWRQQRQRVGRRWVVRGRYDGSENSPNDDNA